MPVLYDLDSFCIYFSNLILEEEWYINRQERDLENAKQRLENMKQMLETFSKTVSNDRTTSSDKAIEETEEPEEPLGDWIKVVYEPKVLGESGWVRFRCSNCTALNDFRSEFCPHCGRKMNINIT